MTGWKKIASALLITTALSLSAALLLASPDHARAASLVSRLHHARHQLRHARVQLTTARRAYHQALVAQAAAGATTAALSDSAAAEATPTPSASAAPSPTASPATVSAATLTKLRAAVRHQRHRVHRLHRLVVALRHRLVFQRAAASGHWMPIVRDAARRNGISATGLRRLMSFESGGRATACNGSFVGLYQYCLSTWHAAWNPYRARSIYDGEAQIRATAVAIRRGWGSSMWPNTYPLAF